jgi:serpin B
MVEAGARMTLGTQLRGLFGRKEEPPGRERPSPPAWPPSVPAPRPWPEPLAADSNDFALAMYERLRERPENLFFSPFSLRTALCMTGAGARGETAAQMRAALAISSSDDELHAAFAEILERLNQAAGGQYEMAVANALWCQEGAPLALEYLDRIERQYGGRANLADFRYAADAAREAINRWVEEKTRQKIRDLIPAGGLHADTGLVLVNALYFKGRWREPFFEAATRDEPFFLEGGGAVEAPLMHRVGDVRHVQAEGYQAVDVDYRGGDVAMLVLLPDRRDGLRDLEKALSPRMLHDHTSQMRSREVELFLPRFSITWGTVNLRDQLIALGMPLAFDPSRADLSGINGFTPPSEKALFVSSVLHKAFVEVNERGTEAAAATGMEVEFGAALGEPPPPPVFRADHPFLFAIHERQSSAILFLGRITDPTR